MLFLEKYTVGLIRETKDGKALNGLTYVSVDAPPEVVWNVLNDFDHYNNFLEGEYKIKKKGKNKVVIDFTSPSYSMLIFNFGGWKMENEYIIEAPDHMYFNTISGLYAGSNGDFQVVPIDKGKRALLFHSTSLNMERDESLTTRMVKSGTFPFDTVMCISVAISEAHSYKKECEARAKRTK
jgi:carbon monoxide dehydrogenase subunit G